MGSFETPISRRRALQIGAAMPLAVLAACTEPPQPSKSPVPASASPTAVASPTEAATALPSPTAAAIESAAPPANVLYRDAAIADGRSATLQRGMSVLVEGGRIAWIRPRSGEGDPGG